MTERVVRIALIAPWFYCVVGWAAWVAVHEGVGVLTGE